MSGIQNFKEKRSGVGAQRSWKRNISSLFGCGYGKDSNKSEQRVGEGGVQS